MRRRSLLGLIALVLVAPIALSGGAARGQTAKPVLKWAPCGDVQETECAGLEAPIDRAKPDGAKITLRLGRVPASGRAKRKGVLLLLPGGPGAGIAEIIGGEMRAAQHIPEFARRYDVVTFDPRGIGKSNPIRCDPQAVPRAEMPMDRMPTQAEFEAVAHDNAAFIKSCAEATGELLWHLTAQDTAADIERIRQALSPNDGIVAYGASYGSAYGVAYLEAYPEHVKALILDAVVDHTVDMPTFMARNVISVQDAFERFAQWCAREAKCALHGKDLGAAFDAAVAREPATRTLVPQLLSTGDHPKLGWPALAQMLAEVNRGESKLLKEMTTAATLSTAGDPWVRIGKDGQFRGVMCSDYGPQQDYARLTAVTDTLAKVAPRFVWKFWDALPMTHASAGVGDCAGWPRAAANPPHRLNVGLHANVMVENATHDPATPLANALSVWLQIPQARLLIADVDGHQALPLSKCAYEVSARFLEDPESASTTTLCAK
jgi:pimeloyl-ACP methyl ester carboxylesterase